MADSCETVVNVSADAIIILTEEDRLIRLYFYAANIESLSQVPLLIPRHTNKTITADIVGKNPNAEKISKELEKHNFYRYSELIRMNRKNEERAPVAVSDVVYAETDDTQEIMDALYEEFDVFIAHLPYRQKLEDAISKREITVVRRQGRIAGLLYCEKLGERLRYLYQVVVRDEYRGMGIADDLFVDIFGNSPRDTVFQLWVETRNEYAMRKYRKHGFTPDGLFDYVMLYKESYNG
jgi:ribosomal protein S18 acetylase RimI-like enzyme